MSNFIPKIDKVSGTVIYDINKKIDTINKKHKIVYDDYTRNMRWWPEDYYYYWSDENGFQYENDNWVKKESSMTKSILENGDSFCQSIVPLRLLLNSSSVKLIDIALPTVDYEDSFVEALKLCFHFLSKNINGYTTSIGPIPEFNNLFTFFYALVEKSYTNLFGDAINFDPMSKWERNTVAQSKLGPTKYNQILFNIFRGDIWSMEFAESWDDNWDVRDIVIPEYSSQLKSVIAKYPSIIPMWANLLVTSENDPTFTLHFSKVDGFYTQIIHSNLKWYGNATLIKEILHLIMYRSTKPLPYGDTSYYIRFKTTTYPYTLDIRLDSFDGNQNMISNQMFLKFRESNVRFRESIVDGKRVLSYDSIKYLSLREFDLCFYLEPIGTYDNTVDILHLIFDIKSIQSKPMKYENANAIVEANNENGIKITFKNDIYKDVVLYEYYWGGINE